MVFHLIALAHKKAKIAVRIIETSALSPRRAALEIPAAKGNAPQLRTSSSSKEEVKDL
jgi:hypothetical protein